MAKLVHCCCVIPKDMKVKVDLLSIDFCGNAFFINRLNLDTFSVKWFSSLIRLLSCAFATYKRSTVIQSLQIFSKGVAFQGDKNVFMAHCPLKKKSTTHNCQFFRCFQRNISYFVMNYAMKTKRSPLGNTYF